MAISNQSLWKQLMWTYKFIDQARHSLKNKDKDAEINWSQTVALIHLSKTECLNTTQLAEILDVKPSSVNLMLQKLIELKYVTKIPNLADKRVSDVKITDSGLEVANQATSYWSTIIDNFFGDIPEEEKEAMHNLLHRLQDNMSNVTGVEQNYKHECNE